MKKDATEKISLISCCLSTLRFSPSAYACKTCLYLATEKIKVTLTLTPLAISSVIAGKPSIVAGTLISKFGLSMIFHKYSPCSIVALVSRANLGSTSIDTLPS